MPDANDDLRAQVEAQHHMAMALFEVQFALCGGRKSGDPTWDDLDSAERDQFWDEARRVLAVLAVLGEPVTEWGVRSYNSNTVEVWPRATEDAARKSAANFDPMFRAEAVCRTVSRTEWREVDSDAP